MAEQGFSVLKGQTLLNIERNCKDGDEIVFITKSGKRYTMFHSQDCCEDVHIEDICSNLNDLIGNPILIAEEVTQEGGNDDEDESCGSDFTTWTFYKLSTIIGSVTIRWIGTSNGYYSESVSFSELDNK